MAADSAQKSNPEGSGEVGLGRNGAGALGQGLVHPECLVSEKARRGPAGLSNLPEASELWGPGPTAAFERAAPSHPVLLLPLTPLGLLGRRTQTAAGDQSMDRKCFHFAMALLHEVRPCTAAGQGVFPLSFPTQPVGPAYSHPMTPHPAFLASSGQSMMGAVS